MRRRRSRIPLPIRRDLPPARREDSPGAAFRGAGIFYRTRMNGAERSLLKRRFPPPPRLYRPLSAPWAESLSEHSTHGGLKVTTELGLVLLLLAATIVMFALNKPRMDAVALLMLAILPLTGVLSMNEALSGFGDPNVILIAALFVVGEALVRTGVAQTMGDALIRYAGPSETRVTALLMIVVAGIGAFMSSTGVVAIFIPIVLRVAQHAAIAPGRLMMPLSVAALISGMTTLVATAPNLVVQGQLNRAGFEGFSFFSFAPFGLPILAFALGYMLLVQKTLGGETPKDGRPKPRLEDWVRDYGLAEREFRLRIGKTSRWIGKRLDALDLRSSAGINIIALERRRGFGKEILQPEAASVLQAGDILFLDLFAPAKTEPETEIAELRRKLDLHPLPVSGHYFSDHTQDIGMVELLVPPGSPLVDSTVAEQRFRTQHGLAVVGIKRGAEPLHDGPVAQAKLKLGDTLLAVGPWRAIRDLRREPDALPLNLPAELDEVVEKPDKAPYALACLALIVGLMVGGIVPNVQAALIGCLLLGLFGCVDMPSAYRSIHWPSLVVIVGMLPFSVALQRTGGVDLAAAGLVALVGDSGPRVALAAIFALTAVCGLFVSNTATAVLMAPVALAVAAELGVSPYPFAMTVALAASAAFMTPVSSPVNMLVVGPGGYKFGDFLRVGVPLTLIAMAVAVLLAPVVFPF